MMDLKMNCGGKFPNWESQRERDGVEFFIPTICQACDFINACAFNSLMQLAKVEEHALGGEEFGALGKASHTKITELHTTNNQISELIGERIVAKIGGSERILKGMPDLCDMIVGLNQKIN